MENIKIENAEKAIFEELNALKHTFIEQKELRKVQNKVESALIFSEVSVANKALNLCYYEMLGDAAAINGEIEKYKAVDVDSIRKTTNKLFDENKVNVLYYLKK